MEEKEGMESLELDSYFDRKYVVQTIQEVAVGTMLPLKNLPEKGKENTEGEKE